MTWRALGVAVAILGALALRWSSVVPSGTGASGARSSQVRLSLGARPERVERCRERSDDELAQLPAHMRLRTACEGYAARYLLRLTLNGQLVAMDTLRGGGMRHDRPLHVFRERDVAPGRQHLLVEVTRLDDGLAPPVADSADARGLATPDTLLGGRADRERDERRRRVADAMPSRLTLDTAVTLAPGRVVLVTFDQVARRLTIRTEW